MTKVVHFEVPYEEAKRAKDFYQKVFGWKINDVPMKDVEYQMINTGPTGEDGMVKEKGFINGGLTPRNEMAKGPVIVMGVEDIHEKLKEVEESGGKTVMDPVPVGEMGFYAYFKDTEDNVIGIWQDKKK